MMRKVLEVAYGVSFVINVSSHGKKNVCGKQVETLVLFISFLFPGGKWL